MNHIYVFTKPTGQRVARGRGRHIFVPSAEEEGRDLGACTWRDQCPKSQVGLASRGGLKH